jgi:hypothetical protein
MIPIEILKGMASSYFQLFLRLYVEAARGRQANEQAESGGH